METSLEVYGPITSNLVLPQAASIPRNTISTEFVRSNHMNISVNVPSQEVLEWISSHFRLLNE